MTTPLPRRRQATHKPVEASNGIDGLKRKRKAIAKDGEIREYVMSHYMLPYARFNATIYRLSI